MPPRSSPLSRRGLRHGLALLLGLLLTCIVAVAMTGATGAATPTPRAMETPSPSHGVQVISVHLLGSNPTAVSGGVSVLPVTGVLHGLTDSVGGWLIVLALALTLVGGGLLLQWRQRHTPVTSQTRADHA